MNDFAHLISLIIGFLAGALVAFGIVLVVSFLGSEEICHVVYSYLSSL